MFIYFRERKGEREGKREMGMREENIDAREKRPLTASPTHPDRGLNLQPLGVQDDAPTKGQGPETSI